MICAALPIVGVICCLPSVRNKLCQTDYNRWSASANWRIFDPISSTHLIAQSPLIHTSIPFTRINLVSICLSPHPSIVTKCMHASIHLLSVHPSRTHLSILHAFIHTIHPSIYFTLPLATTHSFHTQLLTLQHFWMSFFLRSATNNCDFSIGWFVCSGAPMSRSLPVIYTSRGGISTNRPSARAGFTQRKFFDDHHGVFCCVTCFYQALRVKIASRSLNPLPSSC